MANICPVCEKDDAVQRIVTLVSSGQSSSMFSGPMGGATYSDGKWGSVSGYSTLSGSTTNNLAKILAPPNEPKLDTGIIENTCGSLLLFPAIFVVFLLLVTNGRSWGAREFSSINILALLLGTVGVLLLIGSVRKKKMANELRPTLMSNWEKSKECWQRLYFCHRDGIVFDPETKKSFEPTQMEEYIKTQIS